MAPESPPVERDLDLPGLIQQFTPPRRSLRGLDPVSKNLVLRSSIRR
jgi:hypothetical protein